MRYGNLKALIEGHLHAQPGWDGIVCHPGPNDPEIPGRCVVLTPFGGPGVNTEGLFDAVGWQIKVISEQNDYTSGESVAYSIDYFLLNRPTGTYQGQRVTHFQRSGGSPAALLVDDAERTHFVCSYVVDVESSG